MALAGVLAACRITGNPFQDLRVMFLGAGSAATGIADLMHSALCTSGMPSEEARDRLWFVDQFGLLDSNRTDLMSHNIPYIRDLPPMNFLDAITLAQPHVLIGATGAAGTFTQDVIELMSRINQRPVIFALSNPTSKSECTAEQACQWSQGRAVFASGSPFPPVDYKGETRRSGQGNNMYIFPGIGLGVIACNSSRVSEEMFLDAAQVLADSLGESELREGTVYPPLSRIREISLDMATAVAERAYKQGLAIVPKPENLKEMIQATMYDPTY